MTTKELQMAKGWGGGPHNGTSNKSNYSGYGSPDKDWGHASGGAKSNKSEKSSRNDSSSKKDSDGSGSFWSYIRGKE